jgi:hypothetical protein
MDGAETAAEALADQPAGRLCGRCQRIIYTHGSHCPQPCGAFLPRNADALKHGKHSRAALAKRRKEIYADWRARYADERGVVERPVDALLRELSRVESLSERATAYSEANSQAVAHDSQQRAIRVAMDCADRIVRLSGALNALRPAPAAAQAVPPFVIITTDGPDLLEAPQSSSQQLPETAIAAAEPPQALEQPAPTPVVLEAEIVAVAGDGRVSQPVRERGLLVQWNGRTGGVRGCDGAVLLVAAADVAKPEALTLGAALTFVRVGNHCQEVETCE